MALYTRNNLSEVAQELSSRVYKIVAMVAETFVFVYLGMAVFSFPILRNTTLWLVLYALLACFVGRLHIYLGSWLTNFFRTPEQANPQRISAVYQFIMWFSGLRGGVAFALSAVSYANKDFDSVCGGLTREEAALDQQCDGTVTDGLAILQTTLIIAGFTIFVFGGAITEVAVACDVLNPKGWVEPKDEEDKSPWGQYNKEVVLPWLTLTECVPRRAPGIAGGGARSCQRTG